MVSGVELVDAFTFFEVFKVPLTWKQVGGRHHLLLTKLNIGYGATKALRPEGCSHVQLQKKVANWNRATPDRISNLVSKMAAVQWPDASDDPNNWYEEWSRKLIRMERRCIGIHRPSTEWRSHYQRLVERNKSPAG